MSSEKTCTFWMTAVGIYLLISVPAIDAGNAVQAGSSPADATDTQTTPSEETLRNDQLAISGRYTRFERMLSQMADILGKEDPERADLLRRAISKGREQRISERIEGIAKLIESRELGSVIEEQQQVSAGLMMLLKLLQSEDRRSSVEKERERLNDLLKDVRDLIAEERSARAATQNSAAPSNTAPQQQKALDKADSMLNEIDEHDREQSATDESSTDPSDSQDQSQTGDSKDAGTQGQSKGSPESENSEGSEKGDKEKDPDSKSGDGEKKGTKESSESSEKSESSTDKPKPPSDDAPSKTGDPSKSDSQSPSESQPGESQPSKTPSSDSEQSESQQNSQSQQQSQQSGAPDDRKQPKSTPGREQIREAKQLMQEALDQLKKQQKDPAIQKQDKALQELHAAADELEEMLRQLREEEKEMLLAALEARFQRMLALQTQVYEATLELAATPRENWLDLYYGRCRELAQQQAELTSECAQTANLLREDGTSVSILIAVEDIEADMESVAGYLRESRVGTLTQAVETDIIESLKQLIEAAQKEMEEMKSEERQQQQQQSNSEEKPPLVELMAEIKVLRSLQMRVNRRTKQVDELLIKAPKDERSDLTGQLEELAERQQRLKKSAAELAAQMQR